MKFISYTKPSITELEEAYALDAVKTGWGARCYDYISKFEAAFKRHLGSRFAIASSSCTGALHMGLAALGLGPGDEVILADTNWIATVSPVVHLGATPVFVDIDPITWCIDPALVKKAVTSRTKAIIAVHLYGNLCAMDELMAIGAEYGIPVVEDAAEALGSIYRGRRAGSMGKFGAFSFHGTKTMTTGEGGMFVTNDEALYETVLTLSNHGRARGQTKQFFADMIGFKYKMSNVEAAIGLAQLERLDQLVARKRQILQGYRDRLSDLSGVSLNHEGPDVTLGAWMPTAVFAPETGVTRELLMEAFKAHNIDARVFFHPLSSLPMFDDQRQNRHAWDIPGRAMNLPSFHDMTDEDQDRCAEVIQGIVGE